MFEKAKSVVGKVQTLNQSKSLLVGSLLNGVLNSNLIGLSNKFKELNTDEI